MEHTVETAGEQRAASASEPAAIAMRAEETTQAWSRADIKGTQPEDILGERGTHRAPALLARRVDVGVDHGQGAGEALRHGRDVVADAVALQLVGAKVQRPILVVDPHLACRQRRWFHVQPRRTSSRRPDCRTTAGDPERKSSNQRNSRHDMTKCNTDKPTPCRLAISYVGPLAK